MNGREKNKTVNEKFIFMNRKTGFCNEGFFFFGA